MEGGRQTDTEVVLDEVIQLFSGDEDLQIIQKIRKVEEDTKCICKRQQGDMRETIRALAAQNDSMRGELEAPDDTSSIEALKSDIAAAESGLRRMEQENAGLNDQLHALGAEKGRLRDAKAKLLEAEASDVPRQRHAISLYANISNIRWDYQDNGKVKGYIASAGASGIRSFELDPAKQSENFIVNYLWEKMS